MRLTIDEIQKLFVDGLKAWNNADKAAFLELQPGGWGYRMSGNEA